MGSFPEAGVPTFILQKLRPGWVGETLGPHMAHGTQDASSSLPTSMLPYAVAPAADFLGLPMLLRFKLNQPAAVLSRLEAAKSHWHLTWLGV